MQRLIPAVISTGDRGKLASALGLELGSFALSVLGHAREPRLFPAAAVIF